MRVYAWAPAAAVVLLTSVSSVLPVAAQEQSKLKPKDIPRLMEEADKFIAANDLPKAEAYLKAIIGLDPKQSQAAFKLGKLCESQKDWDCTLMNYQLALGSLTGADKAQAHMGLAAGHFQAGRYTDAAEHAAAALALDPSRTQAHLIRAESLVKLKSPEAVAACEAAVKAVPDNAVAQASLGEALLAAGRGADAEAPLKRALELNPKQPATSAQLAQVLSAKGDHAGTIAAASQALAVRARAQGAVRAARPCVPGDGRRGQGPRGPVCRRGRQPDGQGTRARARQDPAQAGSPRRRRAAVPRRDRHRPQAARRAARPGRHPDPHQRLRERADAGDDGRVGAARQRAGPVPARPHPRARQAVRPGAGGLRQRRAARRRRSPARTTAWGASCASRRRTCPGALASMEKAVALDAADPGILTELGAVLYESKQLDRTIETLQKAVATPNYANPMGLAVLGLALKDKKDYEKAIPHAREGGRTRAQVVDAALGRRVVLLRGIQEGLPVRSRGSGARGEDAGTLRPDGRARRQRIRRWPSASRCSGRD